MTNNKHIRFTPLWMAICVVIGILIGSFYANHFSGNRLNIINSSGNKLNNLLHIIDDQYVDTVNVNDLVEKAMPQILSELDPHSVYITARDGEIANDDLRGSFSGIGIEFTIRQDTIRVQNVIGNGPAERAGVLAGDKIVEVDDSVFVGKKVTNAEAMHRLKGPKDTKVKLGVIRYGEQKIRHIIVTYPRQDYKADGRGSYQQIPLVVLVDESSASAAEILAGAIQDNDRGTIIGRRSFGKGLVQKPMEFSDHSMIRLTIARYYTPSGRCIQKPYADGEDYEGDWMKRYKHGEFFSQDSIKHTGPAYHTSNGRTVYGGGGITPDIFIPEDTVDMTSYYKEATMSGLILQFAYTYTDENRARLSKMEDVWEMERYLKSQNTLEKFVAYADKNGLKRRNLMIQKSRKLLERFVNSRIIYNILNEQAWTEYLNQDDPAIIETLRLFKNGDAFPKKPEAAAPHHA